VLAKVKLTAEPWDLGENGYQVGGFPPGWAEWNGKFRDTSRRFWKGEPGLIGELANRITGSADMLAHQGRRPSASVNFITAHDGFTLKDLVSYNDKHNEANGEENRDGINENDSWNCGAEGESEDPEVLALRSRQQRNLLATLLLSQGVPMLLAGDEFGNSQLGNNNAYCQDNEIGWLDWRTQDEDLFGFVQRLIRMRKEHPVFRRPHFFRGTTIRGTQFKDIVWLTPDGREKTDEDWQFPEARSLGFLLGGDAGELFFSRGGRQELDDGYIVMMNAFHEPISFVLPPEIMGRRWSVVFDTARLETEGETFDAGAAYPLEARTLAVLIRKG
jgi:isoamylase